MIDWTPKDADTAVILACDAGYLPFAALLAWQIASKSGPRDFDIVIASEEVLTLPDVLIGYGVRNETLTLEDAFFALPTKTLPRATYLRLKLPSHFASRYRRILYLDCDMQFEGGDISRLLRMDFGTAPIAGVRDIMYIEDIAYHAPEYQAAGLPAVPYFNSGLMLIDTARWEKLQVMQRCLTLAVENPKVFRVHDQSLLNVVLAGDTAELCPVWNWMLVHGHEQLNRQMPVIFGHFVGAAKPYVARGSNCDRRHQEVYREFFSRFYPDWIGELPVRPRLQPVLDRRVDLKRYLYHLRRRKAITAYLAPFTDEWTVLPPKPL